MLHNSKQQQHTCALNNVLTMLISPACAARCSAVEPAGHSTGLPLKQGVAVRASSWAPFRRRARTVLVLPLNVATCSAVSPHPLCLLTNLTRVLLSSSVQGISAIGTVMPGCRHNNRSLLECCNSLAGSTVSMVTDRWYRATLNGFPCLHLSQQICVAVRSGIHGAFVAPDATPVGMGSPMQSRAVNGMCGATCIGFVVPALQQRLLTPTASVHIQIGSMMPPSGGRCYDVCGRWGEDWHHCRPGTQRTVSACRQHHKHEPQQHRAKQHCAVGCNAMRKCIWCFAFAAAAQYKLTPCCTLLQGRPESPLMQPTRFGVL